MCNHILIFQVSENDLKDFVNSKVIDYKKIRGEVIFRNEIPHNSVGKLLRREMRLWAEKISTLERDSL